MLPLLAALALAADDPAPPALKGFDPVELTAGKEVAGKEGLTASHGKYRYAFATPANKAAFEKEPGKYAVQFGGACARMGPLSGGGNPDRYAVFGGRIYLFASDACRDRFRKDPVKFIDAADDEPEGTAADTAKAATLLKKAVVGLGGPAAVAGLKTYQVRFNCTYGSGETATRYTRTDATVFPDTHVSIDDYGKSQYRWLLEPKAGFLAWVSPAPVDADLFGILEREWCRDPVVILFAWQAGKATAVARGADKVGGTAVEKVAVGVRGATTELAMDPATGRVLRAAFKGRLGGAIGAVERTYSDFRAVKGMTVPFGIETKYEGKVAENPKVAVSWVKVNDAVPADLLARPK